jgi:hypothetical protein
MELIGHSRFQKVEILKNDTQKIYRLPADLPGPRTEKITKLRMFYSLQFASFAVQKSIPPKDRENRNRRRSFIYGEIISKRLSPVWAYP